MRDTLELRSRIAMLAALSTAAGAPLACSTPPAPEAVGEREAKRDVKDRDEAARGITEREKYYRAKAEKEGKTFEEVAPARVVAAVRRRDSNADPNDPEVSARLAGTPERRAYYADEENRKKAGLPAAKSKDDAATGSDTIAAAATGDKATGDKATGDKDRFAPIDGDPPFIEGYNPEEDTCVSGNWCGSQADATAISVPNSDTERLGCPARITGARARDNPFPKGKAYAGLSTQGTMQGSLNGHGSELARADGAAADTCCYHWFEYCSGRPHVGPDGPVLASTTPGRAWLLADAGPAEPSSQQRIDALPSSLQARLADGWRDDALMEHASIAAFCRATLELMAVAAPPELVAGCQRAALDEVDHARRCLSLATRYGAEALEPTALPALAPRAAGKAQLVADTFAEGCVGETIAALVAERAARDCDDPEVIETLAVIAADEARHAALAWATIEWAVTTGSGEVADALRGAVRALRPPTDEVSPAADPKASTLARFGRLTAREHWQAKHDAWRDIIEPMLARMLSAALVERRKTTAYKTVSDPSRPQA